MSVLSKTVQVFIRYRDNKICPDGQTKELHALHGHCQKTKV